MQFSIDFNDLSKRALHTFVQSFVGTIGVVWVASGIDVSQVNDMDSAKKIALSALAAVAAAALSALKTTVLQLTGSKSAGEIDTGPGFVEEPSLGK